MKYIKKILPFLFKKEIVPKKQENKNLPVILKRKDRYSIMEEQIKLAYIISFSEIEKTENDLLQ